jgi:hypothetical protein
MTTLLALWYAAVYVGLGVSLYLTLREPKKKTVRRTMPAWLTSIIAHSEPIDGWEDPLFYSDSEVKHGRSKITRT